jgi:signal transduction histidine kinase
MNESEELRRRSMERVSRALHDRVGPALCAAGLHLGLLKNSIAKDDLEAAECLESARAALEESIAQVRALSYQTDPSIVKRLGISAAMSYLAAPPAATVIVESEPAEPKGEVAAMLHRIALECLAYPGPLRIVLERSRLRVESGVAFDAARMAPVIAMAAEAGVTVEIAGAQLCAFPS